MRNKNKSRGALVGTSSVPPSLLRPAPSVSRIGRATDSWFALGNAEAIRKASRFAKGDPKVVTAPLPYSYVTIPSSIEDPHHKALSTETQIFHEEHPELTVGHETDADSGGEELMVAAGRVAAKDNQSFVAKSAKAAARASRPVSAPARERSAKSRRKALLFIENEIFSDIEDRRARYNQDRGRETEISSSPRDALAGAGGASSNTSEHDLASERGPSFVSRVQKSREKAQKYLARSGGNGEVLERWMKPKEDASGQGKASSEVEDGLTSHHVLDLNEAVGSWKSRSRRASHVRSWLDSAKISGSSAVRPVSAPSLRGPVPVGREAWISTLRALQAELDEQESAVKNNKPKSRDIEGEEAPSRPASAPSGAGARWRKGGQAAAVSAWLAKRAPLPLPSSSFLAPSRNALEQREQKVSDTPPVGRYNPKADMLLPRVKGVRITAPSHLSLREQSRVGRVGDDFDDRGELEHEPVEGNEGADDDTDGVKIVDADGFVVDDLEEGDDGSLLLPQSSWASMDMGREGGSQGSQRRRPASAPSVSSRRVYEKGTWAFRTVPRRAYPMPLRVTSASQILRGPPSLEGTSTHGAAKRAADLGRGPRKSSSRKSKQDRAGPGTLYNPKWDLVLPSPSGVPIMAKDVSREEAERTNAWRSSGGNGVEAVYHPRWSALSTSRRQPNVVISRPSSGSSVRTVRARMTEHPSPRSRWSDLALPTGPRERPASAFAGVTFARQISRDKAVLGGRVGAVNGCGPDKFYDPQYDLTRPRPASAPSIGRNRRWKPVSSATDAAPAHYDVKYDALLSHVPVADFDGMVSREGAARASARGHPCGATDVTYDTDRAYQPKEYRLPLFDKMLGRKDLNDGAEQAGAAGVYDPNFEFLEPHVPQVHLGTGPGDFGHRHGGQRVAREIDLRNYTPNDEILRRRVPAPKLG